MQKVCERFFQRVELREERALDAGPGLVPGPEAVAERLDHVIGRHADMRGPRLDHLEHRLQDADHGAEGRVRALVEPALSVEVPEQLVGAVDEVDDHGPSLKAQHRAYAEHGCVGDR